MNEKSVGGSSGISRARESPASYVEGLPQCAGQASEKKGSGPDIRTTFACLSLHMTDRIRLLKFPTQDVSVVEAIIRRTWNRGIQDVRFYDRAKEFKLYGNPWAAPSGWSSDKTDVYRLVCQLLAGMFNIGWILKASVDISRKEYDKDSLLFRLQQPAPPPCIWMCISFDQGDLLHIIDGPREFGPALVQVCGGKVQSHSRIESIFKIKFRGYPWRPRGTETVQTRLLLLDLLDCLESHGFSLYASVDLENNPSGDSNTSAADTWFCNRQADWEPGVPVYHS